jgi:hypothetical protein
MKFFIEKVRDPKTGAIVDLVQIPQFTMRTTTNNGVKGYAQVIDDVPVQEFEEKDILVLDDGFFLPR